MKRRNFLKSAVAANLGLLAIPVANRIAWDDAPVDTITGREVFDRLLATAQKGGWRKLPIGKLIGEVGLQLRGTPYVGSTLEIYDDREVCTVNLLGLDCVTFFESCLGFARMLKKGGSTPADLLAQVTYTRYRDGRMTDYPSRLHYTADWFYNNEEKHVIHDITRELAGAKPFTKQVDFMSTHPGSYRQLKANPKFVTAITEVERRINSRKMYYVPKEDVAAIEPKLQTGDIIGITTTYAGIDCSHTGLCYRDDSGLLRYMHASSTQHKVVLDDELSKYLASVSKHTGIMVARPVEV
jgi:hypothetical protein